MLAIAIKDDLAPPPPKDDSGVGGRGGTGTGTGDGNGGLSLDPLLMALLRKIPSVIEGWPKDKRIRWFNTFAMNVSQVYDADDDPVELKITDQSNRS